MQTKLADFIRNTRDGEEAEAILRACVHCGFCTATCPTYQLLGDELDGPRGRIYLIKQVLEGEPVTEKTQTHLDRCLTCRSCESTCPSGVRYGRLADIGRKVVESKVPRPLSDRIKRYVLKEVLPRRSLFTPAVRLGRLVRPLLSKDLQDKLAPARPAGVWPERVHARRMLVLQGCVQPGLAPSVNAAAARVFDALGITLYAAPAAGCCGALRYHLNDQDGGLDDMRRNIDAWWPHVSGEPGAPQAEAIVMTASGCGASVREYGHLLAHDPAYAVKAQRIAALTQDISEVLAGMESQVRALAAERHAAAGARIAYHPPCTLQHGQQIRGKAEQVLRAAGIEVALCADSHLCCGSAGTYSMLQPELAGQLRERKLAALEETGAPVYASANIGCMTHLQAGTDKPVLHWIEILEQAITSSGR